LRAITARGRARFVAWVNAGAVLCAAALSGCATAPKTLYQWDGYEPALFQHLLGNGADATARIAKLEAQAQKNAAARLASPPGLHGHLALLYLRAGDPTRARVHLETEQRLFPESRVFVSFLLQKISQGETKQ
jgi:hypothetical protein